MDDLLFQIEPIIPALRRYARGLMRDASAADDLVQDCLERVISHWHRRRNSDARTWAFAILHNLAINRMRQTARRGQHVTFDEVEERLMSHAPTQEDGLTRADIASAIEQLPEEQRSVLLLVSVEDFSYSEVADILTIPVGTVMSRLSRARERLKQILENPSRGARPVSHLRRVK
ncbi:sigma-70 family RNA polymerase sigma factor [Rhizobium sp. SL86]|uniref:sigma-70 family RNA polymerase sigma factor n=1 Tax=Rhizobium sp. SL86 TaxID=2995148 RepID=UPI002274C0CF|nr:sigma-70 family RNA polymerase sigma factor [Rhizobium sp. SL86]MCY1666285.1 sigma-70 family RNA polymerase sigma factor [Rhizobium sp. SL86]